MNSNLKFSSDLDETLEELDIRRLKKRRDKIKELELITREQTHRKARKKNDDLDDLSEEDETVSETKHLGVDLDEHELINNLSEPSVLTQPIKDESVRSGSKQIVNTPLPVSLLNNDDKMLIDQYNLNDLEKTEGAHTDLDNKEPDGLEDDSESQTDLEGNT